MAGMRTIIALILAGLASNAALSEAFVDVTTLQVGVKHRPGVCDRKAEKGDVLEVLYTGWLVDGTEFRSRETLKFQLGEGEVIEGWEQGISGMCVGEKRRLKVPAHLAYQDKGHADLGVPADASLFFDAELLSAEEGPQVIWAMPGGGVELPM